MQCIKHNEKGEQCKFDCLPLSNYCAEHKPLRATMPTCRWCNVLELIVYVMIAVVGSFILATFLGGHGRI